MNAEVERKKALCERASDPDWEDRVLLAENLTAAQKAFIREHPPGLVEALWSHFEATRDRCGCASATHERPGCTVRLIDRLLLDDESA